MTMIPPRYAVACLAALVVLAAPCLASPAQEQSFTLVEDGQDPAPIVLFENAPPFTAKAAQELATYIEKASGARPELIKGEPETTPDRAIWVGYQPKLDELFPDISFDFAHPEEIVIAANESHLVIAGRDRWNPDALVVEGKDRTIHGRQQEYGTVNAVYTFLQKYLGVRWLWPGELGEDIRPRQTITFEPFTYRYHPQVRGRSGLFAFSSLGNEGYGRSYQWTRRQRLQLDSLNPSGGHAFTDWWRRFHESHPEYFALQPDGTRGGGDKPFPSARTVKLCLSNPAVAQQWLQDVEKKLEKNPNQTVFNAAPNDSWASGHCICADCRAWDHPKGEMRTFRWEGLGQECVALSDRHVKFANRCGKLLKEHFPNKDYYVLMLAYGHSRPAPVEARPRENVIISSVANFLFRRGSRDRGSAEKPKPLHRTQFDNWGDVAPNLMWRPNAGNTAGWIQGRPDVPITQTIEDLKFAAENNMMAIFVDHVWEHWSTQGPLYYVMAQLTWDPSKDAQAILEDYYRRGFGPAADTIAAYWRLLEDKREAYRASDAGYPAVYDDAFFEKASGLLDDAASAMADGPTKYRDRLAFLRAGLKFTRLATENRALAARYRESGKADTKAAQQMRENYEKIREICKQHPYAINWGVIRPNQGRVPHPDHM